MEFNKHNRLLLINQYKILAALNKDDEASYLELIEILESGYSIFYSMIQERISDEMSEEKSEFVLDVLELYQLIYDAKKTTEDTRITDHHLSNFIGFDGNSEFEYRSFCQFLIETQGKFEELKSSRNDRMNSHTKMVDTYHEMLERKGEIASQINGRLSADQVIYILSGENVS